MSLPAVDRAYANLLTHIQRPGSGIPLDTVVSTVPHYLAQLPLPNPTQLTAFIISSPLWRPVSFNCIRSLINLYRSAVHLKEANVQKSVGWFGRDSKALVAEWASAIMKGVSRGDPQLRISVLGGLLLGFGDLSYQVGLRGRLEGQVVIACAEMLETLSTGGDVWKNEFRVLDAEGDSLFLYSIYHILPLVENKKLLALDVQALARVAQRGMEKAFSFGEFLSQLSQSAIWGPQGMVLISPESSLSISLQEISGNILYAEAGSLTRLLSRCLSILPDQEPRAAWQLYSDVCKSLLSITSKVERDWKQSLLATITSDDEVEPKTRALSTQLWKVLKTLLFTHLIVDQSVLSAIAYLRPIAISHSPTPNPSALACSILCSLYHLCFVITQFGGVTSTGDEFQEMKRVFYISLDIIAADTDPQTSNLLIEKLLSHAQESQLDSNHPFKRSQAAFVLAVAEQLISALNESTIEGVIVPYCQSYLSDPDHRETYESAHSVMLSIFATHSQHSRATRDRTTRPSLAERLVPFYTELLIQNTGENRLSTSQLRLAYSSLVQSAASGEDDALVWLCLDALLDHLAAAANTTGNSMHISLTLISLISCVPLSLLPRVLSEVNKILEKAEDSDRTKLGEAILKEITHRVGDREKEAVLEWWYREVSLSNDNIS